MVSLQIFSLRQRVLLSGVPNRQHDDGSQDGSARDEKYSLSEQGHLVSLRDAQHPSHIFGQPSHPILVHIL